MLSNAANWLENGSPASTGPERDAFAQATPKACRSSSIEIMIV